MEKETVNEIQEAQKDPGRINPRRNTSGLTVIKWAKIKDRGKKNQKHQGERNK